MTRCTSGPLHLNLHTMSPHAKSAKTRRREVRVAPPNWNPSRPSRLRVRGQSSAHWDHQNKVKRSTSTPIPNYQILLTPCSGPGARPHPGGVDFPPARPGQWTVVGITLGGGGRGGGSPPYTLTLAIRIRADNALFDEMWPIWWNISHTIPVVCGNSPPPLKTIGIMKIS